MSIIDMNSIVIIVISENLANNDRWKIVSDTKKINIIRKGVKYRITL